MVDSKIQRIAPYASRRNAEGTARDLNHSPWSVPAIAYCTPKEGYIFGKPILANPECAACPLLKLKPKKEVKMARTKKKKSGCK